VGRLTQDMTRLCGEIQNLRESRQALKEVLADANRERQMDVLEMCADFAGTLARNAKRAHEKRLAGLNNLKQAVAVLKRDIRADLAVVRRAWTAKSA
jgi:2-oxo-4-hydroxy-4-carboxy--5-ureidoimidazoline (OHCU) decarboxylase